MSKCKQRCGVSLLTSLVVGIILLLIVYIIVSKVSSNGSKSKAGSTMASAGKDLEMSEQEALTAGSKTGSKPLVIMLYMDGCGHCQMMKPDFVQVASELSQTAQFGCVDGMKAKKICDSNGIRGFPCMIKYKNGKQVDKAMGRQNKDAIRKFAQ